MAKQVKVKKDQDPAAPAKKGEKKADAKGKVKEAPAKGKAKGKKEEPRGLKARMAKAQAVKQGKSAKGGASAREKKGTGKFLREVRVEMSKVTWPSRDELVQSTIVVLIAVTIAGTFIAIMDAIFSRLVSLIS